MDMRALRRVEKDGSSAALASSWLTCSSAGLASLWFSCSSACSSAIMPPMSSVRSMSPPTMDMRALRRVEKDASSSSGASSSRGASPAPSSSACASASASVCASGGNVTLRRAFCSSSTRTGAAGWSATPSASACTSAAAACNRPSMAPVRLKAELTSAASVETSLCASWSWLGAWASSTGGDEASGAAGKAEGSDVACAALASVLLSALSALGVLRSAMGFHALSRELRLKLSWEMDVQVSSSSSITPRKL